MNVQRLHQIVENPNFIEGIYNYCDRWCERCQFTSRCANYALEKDVSVETRSRDQSNKEFWHRLHETFQMTLDCIRDIAKERGIDLEHAEHTPDMAEDINRKAKQRETAQKHDCSVASKAYSKIVDDWFHANSDQFTAKQNELTLQKAHNLSTADPDNEAVEIKEAIEVIRWYQHQIYVKIVRALTSSFRSKTPGEEQLADDSRGSAKVAIIGIDRSIAAWVTLYSCFPQRADSILDILAHLDRLRTKAEEAFPDARRFVRMGLDDEE